MKDINAFVQEWNGKYVGSPIAGVHQCVALVKQWEAENGWETTWGNAIDYWTHGEAHYNKVANNPSNLNQFPPAGALVVFEIGQYGHIGIALPGTNGHHIVLFNQNDPIGKVSDVLTFDYVHPKCLGWLVHA